MSQTDSGDPVTVSISRKVLPGREADYEAWIGDVSAAAALEAVFMGPELEFTADAVVAVTGAELPPHTPSRFVEVGMDAALQARHDRQDLLNQIRSSLA